MFHKGRYMLEMAKLLVIPIGGKDKCMTQCYTLGVTPMLDHYTRIVEFFSWARNFNKGIAVIEKMPSFDHLPFWLA